MKPVILHREAIAELDRSISYYETQKVGLGLDLLATVEQAIAKIQQNPNLGASYTIAGVRRYIIPRFPFQLFYTELEHLIWVVAIAHSKRRPGYWSKRQLE
ncbi:type II toxin-antitoxin system RelE/ParE family toxin [Pantanalinema rosaneae CENA516]|uniref:type II toxin-antitoxin system RelE/ParE family toxin n=1 Tax=Pantanalinema rosaneae TaxID=1620701 RepID=UPI003D6F7423